LLLVGIDNMAPFNDVYGFVAGDEVLRFTAIQLNESVNEMGTLDDFIGHASNESFTLITMTNDVQALMNQIRKKFNEGVSSHYNFMDREQGGVTLPDGAIAPLMRISIGMVSSQTQQFSDIREITETAAEMRRLDQQEQDQQQAV